MSSPHNILLRRARILPCFISAVLLFINVHAAYAQQLVSLPSHSLELDISAAFKDSIVALPHQFILSGSDTLRTIDGYTLSRDKDYMLDHRRGWIELLPGWIDIAEPADTTVTLLITYQYFPFTFRDNYYLRKLIVLSDTTDGDTIRVARARGSPLSIDDLFGPSLQKSGSIVRGFTVGSNRDLSLNSGLRLQFAGRIASDIDVAAVLTDESTPIQPEGTTQTLQEFDKVFVEMRGGDFAATLGDFNLEFTETEFARLSRKLQGAQGTADYRFGFSRGSVTLSGAVPRGKFVTHEFTGLDGVQGPYRLRGRNNETHIIVIAGTERVYLDGIRQMRGETNDYVIDYTSGELTFTVRRLITSASRIVVDFEYTDRQFERSLIAAQTSSAFLENMARLRLSYFREADNPDAPVDFILSDSARAVIAAAGSDRLRATLDGVTRVDSNGLYIRVDTLVGAQQVTFYRYAPGNPAALYNVQFSNVGPGRGEYVRRQIGVFEWRGTGGGDYLPIILLPIPQSVDLFDAELRLSPLSDLIVAGEFASSRFDANRFSSLDDAMASGHAVKVSALYTPRDVTIGGTNIGGFDLSFKERYVNSRFVSLDRTNDIEFGRKWGFVSAQGNEEIQEGALKYLPTSSISVGGGYGRITRGTELRSVRNDGTLLIGGEGMPDVQYYMESVRSTEYNADNKSSWLRQRGTARYSIWKAIPRLRYENEDRTIKSLATDTVKAGSFGYSLWAPGLELRELGKLTLSAEYEWRTDDAFMGGSVMRASRAFTQGYAARLSEWNHLQSTLEITLRERKFSDAFKLGGSQDIQTVLVRSQSRYTPLNRGIDTDLLYQVSTEQSSRLERVFVRVAQGTGNYRYLGDLNNNGVADEDEFELTRFDGDFIAVTVPTEDLFPVIDLRTGLRVRITPRLFLEKTAGTVEGILSALSSETYVRVEEKSSERDLKRIYLLNLSRFRQDSTTISGSTLFTQDIHVFEGQPSFSTRLRFSQRKGLNNLSGGIERSFARERSIRMRWQLVREISNQLDVSNRIDRVGSTHFSPRVRDILSNSIAFDFSYRPEQHIELGLRTEAGSSIDRRPSPEVKADLNTQAIRFVYAFQGAGQARVETAREEVLLGTSLETVPFELTGGRVPGKTWLWRVAFDYRVTQFVQATVNYDGRSEGGGAPVHTARAEVRAFF
jgi:hypothetical protein